MKKRREHFDPARGDIDHAIFFQPRERARHSFDREPEVVGDVAATHRQRGSTQARVHLKQKVRYAFESGLSAEQQHAISGMVELVHRQFPTAAGRPAVAQGKTVDCAAGEGHQHGIDDGFGGHPLLQLIQLLQIRIL